MTEVVKILDDETEVRVQSQNRLEDLSGNSGFERVSKHEYVLDRQYTNFETLTEHLMRSDPVRRKRLPSVESELREQFDRLSERSKDGFVLRQPCVAYQFRKVPRA